MDCSQEKERKAVTIIMVQVKRKECQDQEHCLQKRRKERKDVEDEVRLLQKEKD